MNLKTIAQKAGVSTATVSNVINGNNHKVSEETRRRVNEIIKETNYKPNAMARSLAKKESRIIGLEHIQVQAVLSLIVGDRQILAGEFRIVVGLINAVVRRNIHRCFKGKHSADRCRRG